MPPMAACLLTQYYRQACDMQKRRNMIENIPKVLIDKAQELEKYYEEKFPALAKLAKPCFLSTIKTTVKQLSKEEYFVITGDIPAMWLRDSSFQVMHYVPYAKEDEQLQRILKGIILKQTEQIVLDPYANAFNETPSGAGHKDLTKLNDWIWERKYELDSLCAPLYLAYQYWKETGDDSIFGEAFLQMLDTIYNVIKVEQHHEESPYSFQRLHCNITDSLACDGRGNKVGYTGMSWSGFRPSDDCCQYGYLVPSNIMAYVAIGYVEEIIEQIYLDMDKKAQWAELRKQIQKGITQFGITNHPKYGEIYAYETDGLGHYNFMDDANSPSLLAMPYLQYCEKEDSLYQNTRKFLLSKDNPYYTEGKAARGIGSPHTPEGYIWHIGIVMQALTSANRNEILECLNYLAATHADTNFMHESFQSNDPSQFTREWFAWANSLFATLLVELKKENFFD